MNQMLIILKNVIFMIKLGDGMRWLPLFHVFFFLSFFLNFLQHKHKESCLLQKDSRASWVFPRAFFNHLMVQSFYFDHQFITSVKPLFLLFLFLVTPEPHLSLAWCGVQTVLMDLIKSYSFGEVFNFSLQFVCITIALYCQIIHNEERWIKSDSSLAPEGC